MKDYQHDFIDYALECGVLKFGEFTLKSGRISPYFFNTGLFDTGAKLGRLGRFYAQALLQSGIQADVLYGPAYKGIPLVCATAIAFAELTGKDMPFAFNRKEAKDHGEGGSLVGAPLKGKIVIFDDVITAGTSVGESVEIIRAAGAEPAGVVIALDRQEKGNDGRSAVAEVQERYGMPVVPIIALMQIVDFLQTQAEKSPEILESVTKYRSLYGVDLYV